ncbi:MAG: hypothetical protein K2Q20_09510, partial [Phycisphaerales bacterium]|nr:hypothetical protein [Phycisphaerales bacterium]
MTTPPWRINVFGVRHLSPAGAWHLRRYLDAIRPELVLIEGLADATELIPQITRRDTKPPIALLAYTDALPVRTLVYPLATYSPEFQAMCWAKEHDVRAEFIDLPSDIFLALQDIEAERRAERRRKLTETPPPEAPADPPVPPHDLDRSPVEASESLYEQCAQRAGEPDYETYWERHFEHNLSPDAYRLAAYEFGDSLRDWLDPKI